MLIEFIELNYMQINKTNGIYLHIFIIQTQLVAKIKANYSVEKKIRAALLINFP